MLFNSFEFLLFFPIVTALFYILPHKFRWFHLLVASCFFYSFFIPIYILILFFTIVIDYYAGLYIEQSSGKKKKQFLVLSLIANIGILMVFKYYNFFIENINTAFLGIGMHLSLPLLKIILPIGLSFHTFQAMSYTIEVYRGNQKAEKHFGIYALYVMFYPQLVAGPIERPQNVLHQFHEVKTYNSEVFKSGMRLILWGLFKKVVIGDRLSIYVDVVFPHPENYHYINLLMAAVFFSIQIYCDFSGYSDIAIGTARSMGYELMTNFNRPYFSKNIQEFWSKWHISLSTWFRDYLYISLGGNRVGIKRMYINVAIVFIISGFWHGANWTFIVWGAIHAILIVLFMLYKQFVLKEKKVTKFLSFISILFTFSVVTLAWVYFRAGSIAEANSFLQHLLSANANHPFSTFVMDKELGFTFNKFSILLSAFFVALMLVVEYFYDPNLKKFQQHKVLDFTFFTVITCFIILFGVFNNKSFIYFQF
jgi:D-alanyl-lipoteichoic acid acyltransferase DltB (MBOAT superfamily)